MSRAQRLSSVKQPLTAATEQEHRPGKIDTQAGKVRCLVTPEPVS